MAIGINLSGDDYEGQDLRSPTQIAEDALRSMNLTQLTEMARSLAVIQAEKFNALLQRHQEQHAVTHASVLAQKLEPNHVQWVTNSLGELGVCLAGTYVFLSRDPSIPQHYKAPTSVIYREQPDGERILVRNIGPSDVNFAARGRNHLTEPEGTWTDLFPDQE